MPYSYQVILYGAKAWYVDWSTGNTTMAKAAKRAALYVRVSTDHQSVENQIQQLRQVAERRGWNIVEIYRDAGISRAKGRDQRPGLDALLNEASRRKFDVVMAWAIDRLGRSLIDLLGTIQHLEAVGVDLYLDQQSIDTTTPAGKLLFQLTVAFAEFERSMIRQRVRAGLSVIKVKIERDGKFVSKTGKVRRRLGRPGAEAHKLDLARQELMKGTGIGKTARLTGLGTGTVHKLKREIVSS
jgi:DNA invertase Pin-like site-specific DNA recombinase